MREPAPKFGRYRFSVSVQVPEAAAPAGEAHGGSWIVESGSFRVDTAWMIEKLRKHQLGDPRDFMVPMLRSGVASGATKISLARLSGGLVMHFDGRPFGARELSDPLHALIDRDDESAVRNLHFAYGLLALERLGPDMVQVTSGGPPGQSSVLLTDKGTGPAGRIGINRAEGTSIVVRWEKGVSWWKSREVFKRVEERYGLTSAALFVEGRLVANMPALRESGWHSFERDGWLGLFRFREEEGPSRLRLYCLGAFVQEIRERLDSRQVDAYLGGGGLTLDISQSGIVRDWGRNGQDSSLAAGLKALSAEAQRYY
ncbi:MAG: hypothetical protein WCI75_11770 [candidate division NC10 bacterium]